MPLISIDTEALKSKVKNPKLWIIIVLSILVVGGGVWWWTAREKRHRDAIISRDNLISALNIKWIECINAEPDTSYGQMHVILPSTGFIRPTPSHITNPNPDTNGTPVKPSSIVSNSDSNLYNFREDCPKGYYDTTTHHGNFSIHFEALGCLRWYRILSINLDTNYMIIKRNQVIIQHDTVPIYPIKKWQWGVEGQTFITDFNSMPGLS